MALARIHLLSRAEPWYAGDNLEVACGVIVLHPVAKGMIDDCAGLSFNGVCPQCLKAIQYREQQLKARARASGTRPPRHIVYAIVEAQEALTPEALEATA